ncbi:MAG: hypothetical protein RBU23_07735 [Candidatus Auribacterota bacterium]|jgi:hypothetical protein|nr:hypothetical protein [Candidatus Auribacterota bacterium]
MPAIKELKNTAVNLSVGLLDRNAKRYPSAEIEKQYIGAIFGRNDPQSNPTVKNPIIHGNNGNLSYMELLDLQVCSVKPSTH